MSKIDKGRLGKCYQLAGNYATKHKNCQLVHGSIEGMGNPRLGHAWVITESGQIWEPITNQLWPPDTFEAFFSPLPEITYSARDAARCMLLSGHFGPWHIRLDDYLETT